MLRVDSSICKLSVERTLLTKKKAVSVDGKDGSQRNDARSGSIAKFYFHQFLLKEEFSGCKKESRKEKSCEKKEKVE